MRKVEIGGLVDEDRRPGGFGEPAGARDVIGLHVGLDDVTDPHVLLSRRFEVGLDVVLWIHHSAAGCAASAEHVARAAWLGREEMAKNHGAPPAACHTAGRHIGSNTSWQLK